VLVQAYLATQAPDATGAADFIRRMGPALAVRTRHSTIGRAATEAARRGNSAELRRLLALLEELGPAALGGRHAASPAWLLAVAAHCGGGEAAAGEALRR